MAFSYSSQYGAMGAMVGIDLEPSKIPGFILSILSGASGFFGTKLLKKTGNK